MIGFFCGCERAPDFEEEQRQEIRTAINTIVPTNTMTPTATQTHTPTATFTLTLIPTPTPTPLGGGSGRLLFSGWHGDSATNFYQDGVYSYDLFKNKTNLVLDGFVIADILPSGDQLLVYPTNLKHGIYLYDIKTNIASRFLDGYVLVDIAPDGNYFLVYKHDSYMPTDLKMLAELFLVNSNGTSLNKIGSGFSPYYGSATWLTNSVLMFTEKINNEISVFSYNPEGNIEQIIQSTKDGLQFLPSIFDGGIIWYEGQYQGDRGGILIDGYNWTSLDGLETKKLFRDFNPAISPNGKYLVYETTKSFSDIGNLYITDNIDLANQVTLKLADYIEGLPSGPKYYWGTNIFWFPDSQRIFATILSCSHNEPCNHIKPMVFSVEGTLLKELCVSEDDINYSANWSPDGKQILVYCDLSYRCLLDTESGKILELRNFLPTDLYSASTVIWLP
jgi:hypothetical protein